MNDLSHFFEEHFHAVATCPLCRKKYNPLEARVIIADDGVELVHVECQRCHGAIIAKIAASHEGVTSIIGVVTDLSSRDLFRLRAREPITTDDVLSFAHLLERDNGTSFVRLVQD